MKVGDLVKLADWCINGPALLQLIETPEYGSYTAMFLEGPRLGESALVNPGNVFFLGDYESGIKAWRDRKDAYESR